MPSKRVFLNPKTGNMYEFDRDTNEITISTKDGEEETEILNPDLVHRLTAQGVPDVLWRGGASSN